VSEPAERTISTGEHAVEGLEHLQAAALELIAAARAFLDAAEDLVRAVPFARAEEEDQRPVVRRIHVS
jgi:hypothetical protein